MKVKVRSHRPVDGFVCLEPSVSRKYTQLKVIMWPKIRSKMI